MSEIARILTNSRAHARSRIRLIDALLEDVVLPEAGDALEVGCGAGHSAAHLARRFGMSVTGTDVESERVEIAERKNGNSGRLSFLTADATALPFEDASFDLVLSQNVFHHIPGWAAAAGEIARVVRPGGLFLFSEIRRPGRLTRLLSRLEKDHGFHHKDELVTTLAGLGLKTIRHSEPAGSLHKEYAILFKKTPA